MSTGVYRMDSKGFWIFYQGREYQVPFETFPWFKKCPIGSIYNYEVDNFGNFHWPDIEVDLNIDILEHPENYPLISK